MPTPANFTHRPLTLSSSPLVLNPQGPGTFYFAFGSNLSPTQMAIRCTSTPTRSSLPIAIARLRGWKWHINKRGCANIAYTGNKKQNQDEEMDEVWGIVYDMSVEDEEILDGYEGVDWGAPEAIRNIERSWGTDYARERPTEQGDGRHNKVYLEVEIVEWKVKAWEEQLGNEKIRVLVYPDEYRTEEGVVRDSYIGRMNRAIGEALGLGLSEEWVSKVVRPVIPEGVEASDGYVGGDGK